MEIRYRDHELTPVTIKLEAYRLQSFTPQVGITYSLDSGEEEYAVVIQFSHLVTVLLKEEGEDALLNVSSKLAKWYVLSGRYKEFTYSIGGEYKTIKVGINEKLDIQAIIRDKELHLNYPPLKNLHVEEHKLARKIIIHLLYQEGGQLNSILEQASFPAITY